MRIDLEPRAAKDLYQPGSAVVDAIAEEFGWDVLDAIGGIDRVVLARRAFDTPEDADRLNAIVHPILLEQLGLRLLPANCCSVMVPEHQLAVVDSVRWALPMRSRWQMKSFAVTAPLETRRLRAVERGMDADDFDRRAECQPAEEATSSPWRPSSSITLSQMIRCSASSMRWLTATALICRPRRRVSMAKRPRLLAWYRVLPMLAVAVMGGVSAAYSYRRRCW